MTEGFDLALLPILACPNDKLPLSYCKDDNCLVNPRLKLRYNIDDGVMRLLPESGIQLSEEEFKAMKLADH